MRKARAIAIGAGLAVLVAAAVGWRGSRPSNPTAEVHADGVTVVPATGTLRREGTRPSPQPPASTPTPSSTAQTTRPIRLDMDTDDELPAILAAQVRDPGWAPVAESRLRAVFADVPHLGAAPRIACGATLCAVEGIAPNGLSPTEMDALIGTLQGSALARTRPDFAENMVRVDRPDDAPPRFTVWLVRR